MKLNNCQVEERTLRKNKRNYNQLIDMAVRAVKSFRKQL